MFLSHLNSKSFFRAITITILSALGVSNNAGAVSESSSHALISCRGPAMKNPVLEIAFLANRIIVIEHSENQFLGALDYRSRMVFEDSSPGAPLTEFEQTLKNRKGEEVTVGLKIDASKNLVATLKSSLRHLNGENLTCRYDLQVGWDFVDLENQYPTKE